MIKENFTQTKEKMLRMWRVKKSYFIPLGKIPMCGFLICVFSPSFSVSTPCQSASRPFTDLLARFQLVCASNNMVVINVKMMISQAVQYVRCHLGRSLLFSCLADGLVPCTSNWFTSDCKAPSYLGSSIVGLVPRTAVRTIVDLNSWTHPESTLFLRCICSQHSLPCASRTIKCSYR